MTVPRVDFTMTLFEMFTDIAWFLARVTERRKRSETSSYSVISSPRKMRRGPGRQAVKASTRLSGADGRWGCAINDDAIKIVRPNVCNVDVRNFSCLSTIARRRRSKTDREATYV